MSKETGWKIGMMNNQSYHQQSIDRTLNLQPDNRLPTPKNIKVNGEEEELLTPEQIMVGSRTKVMTHQERQAYLKNSEIGKKLGISHLM